MTAKLNQIIAVEKGIKSRVHGEVTDLYKLVQKPDHFVGFTKEYRKKDDEAEDLPPERKRVQLQADDVLRTTERLMTELWDVTARKDWTNCVAKAAVVIDGAVIIEAVPVPFLLFLEKQLTDLRTMVTHLPLLDDGEDWTRDTTSGLYKAAPTETHRTKKTVKPLVLYQATKEHPAQTQLLQEDVIAGFWHLVKQSGAMAKADKEGLLERIERLLRGVKEARETANMQDEIESPKVGDAVFAYLMAN